MPGSHISYMIEQRREIQYVGVDMPDSDMLASMSALRIRICNEGREKLGNRTECSQIAGVYDLSMHKVSR